MTRDPTNPFAPTEQQGWLDGAQSAAPKELVEAVARALAATQDDAWDNPSLFMVDSNDTAEDGRESYRGMARAAIALITPAIRALIASKADPSDDGQPDEAQEWSDYDPDC